MARAKTDQRSDFLRRVGEHHRVGRHRRVGRFVAAMMLTHGISRGHPLAKDRAQTIFESAGQRLMHQIGG